MAAIVEEGECPPLPADEVEINARPTARRPPKTTKPNGRSPDGAVGAAVGSLATDVVGAASRLPEGATTGATGGGESPVEGRATAASGQGSAAKAASDMLSTDAHERRPCRQGAACPQPARTWEPLAGADSSLEVAALSEALGGERRGCGPARRVPRSSDCVPSAIDEPPRTTGAVDRATFFPTAAGRELVAVTTWATVPSMTVTTDSTTDGAVSTTVVTSRGSTACTIARNDRRDRLNNRRNNRRDGPGRP